MSAFSLENPHDDKTFENYTRFEWGVEVDVVTTFMLRLFVPHEFDMEMLIDSFVIFFRPRGLFEASFLRNYFWQEAVERRKLSLSFLEL